MTTGKIPIWMMAKKSPIKAQSAAPGMPAAKSPIAKSEFWINETPIIPLILKDEVKVIEICRSLQKKGVFVNPIIYPVVSKNKSRLRISLTSGLTKFDLDYCFEMLQQSELEFRSWNSFEN